MPRIQKFLDNCDPRERLVYAALLGRRKATDQEKRVVTAVVFSESGKRTMAGRSLTAWERTAFPAVRKALRRAAEVGGDAVIARYKQWAVDIYPSLRRMLDAPPSNGSATRARARG